jgi:hypothetical protein
MSNTGIATLPNEFANLKSIRVIMNGGKGFESLSPEVEALINDKVY